MRAKTSVCARRLGGYLGRQRYATPDQRQQAPDAAQRSPGAVCSASGRTVTPAARSAPQMAPNTHGQADATSREAQSDGDISSLPGIWKYPAFRDEPLKSGPLWLQGRRRDEGVGDLWRVHDSLYDFSSWLHSHPGGAEWLRMTQGTDITEAFEAHHISATAKYLLPRFFVKNTSVPRNSPYTFLEDGFYCTLRKRIHEAFKDKIRGPTFNSKITTDSLLAGALLTAVLAGVFWSFTLGIISGILLALTTVCAHNFFHQKDNIRMYYFDLSLMSSRHWRISHALSHHLFPNSVLDLEISLFEPLLQYLPKSDKTFWGRYGPWLYSPIVYAFLFLTQFILRIVLYVKGIDKGPRKDDLIPFIVPAIIYFYGGCEMQHAVIMWLWIITVSSFTFGLIGLNAAHHHPDIFHDGDKPRQDLDWGIQQLDAVQDRPVISQSHFLSLVTFGNHTLHHLFPTIDHGRLDLLMPIFLKTCKEFDVEFKKNTVLGLVKGQFQQCARNTPNIIPPGGFKQ